MMASSTARIRMMRRRRLKEEVGILCWEQDADWRRVVEVGISGGGGGPKGRKAEAGGVFFSEIAGFLTCARSADLEAFATVAGCLKAALIRPRLTMARRERAHSRLAGG